MVRNVLRLFVPPSLRPSSLVLRAVRRHLNGQVISGPFQGMRYVSTSVGSTFYPKVLGTYELEIADRVVELASRADRIVVAGAAEGYYAVGLARHFPGTDVIAFEGTSRGRDLIAELASLNGVEVGVRGFCDARALRQALEGAQHPFVLMDIEGGEAVLADPQVVPDLLGASLVVELHDFLVEGLSGVVASRFGTTHRTTIVPSVRRELEDMPFPAEGAVRRFPSQSRFLLLDEQRPAPMAWLVCEAG